MGLEVILYLLLVALTATQIRGLCDQGGVCGGGLKCEGKEYADKDCGFWTLYNLCIYFRGDCGYLKPDDVCCETYPSCLSKDGYCCKTCDHGVISETSGCGEDLKCCKSPTCSEVGGTCDSPCKYHALLPRYDCPPGKACCTEPCSALGGTCGESCEYGVLETADDCSTGTICCAAPTCSELGGTCDSPCKYHALLPRYDCPPGKKCCTEPCSALGGTCGESCEYGVLDPADGCSTGKICCAGPTCSQLGGECKEICEYGILSVSDECSSGKKCCAESPCIAKGGYCSDKCQCGEDSETQGCDSGQLCCEAIAPYCSDLPGGTCSESCEHAVMTKTRGCVDGQKCCTNKPNKCSGDGFCSLGDCFFGEKKESGCCKDGQKYCIDNITKVSTTGRKVGGVKKSEEEAGAHLEMAKRYRPLAERLEMEYGVSKCIILAIASRESNFGKSLDDGGWGDKKNGYGIMQVDRKSHQIDKSVGPCSYANFKQGTAILKKFMTEAKALSRFKDWTPEWKLRAGIVAYNFGLKNAQTKENLDKKSAHDDYSSDVVARAQYYKRKGLC